MASWHRYGPDLLRLRAGVRRDGYIWSVHSIINIYFHQTISYQHHQPFSSCHYPSQSQLSQPAKPYIRSQQPSGTKYHTPTSSTKPPHHRQHGAHNRPDHCHQQTTRCLLRSTNPFWSRRVQRISSKPLTWQRAAPSSLKNPIANPWPCRSRTDRTRWLQRLRSHSITRPPSADEQGRI